MVCADAAKCGLLQIELAFSPVADTVELLSLKLPAGASVGDALLASGWIERDAAALRGDLTTSVWGRPAGRDQRLLDGDRIELCRPLAVDPKEARRLRYREQTRRRVLR